LVRQSAYVFITYSGNVFKDLGSRLFPDLDASFLAYLNRYLRRLALNNLKKET
jgi:hypothetical protein